MRYLFGFVCVCALGVVPLVGCGQSLGPMGGGGSGGTAGTGGSGGTAGTGGAGACADWAGEWTASSVSCDGVAESIPRIDYVFAANCNGVMIFAESATCESTAQVIFMPEAGGAVIDLGAVTCSPDCTAVECQATADWGQPFTTTISHSDNTLTMTFLATAQMVSDEVTACQAGETQVSVLVAR